MADLSAEAHQLIERDGLGSLVQVYYPQTALNIFIGLFAMGCAAFIAFLPSIVSENSSASSDELSMFNMFMYLMVIFLAGIGLWMIGNAIYNHKTRVAICTRGVAFLQPSGPESFRWQDILTTTRLAMPKRGLTYTVHCRDGRKIVFKNLSRIEDLAEDIDVQIARAKQP